MFIILTGTSPHNLFFFFFLSDFQNIWAKGRNWVVERKLVLRLLIFLSHLLLYRELQKWSSGSLYIKFRSYGFRFCLGNQGFIVLEQSIQFRSFFLKGWIDIGPKVWDFPKMCQIFWFPAPWHFYLLHPNIECLLVCIPATQHMYPYTLINSHWL